MYFSYRVKRMLVAASVALMIAASLVFVLVDFKTKPIVEAEIVTVTTISAVTTTVSEEPTYQDLMLINCQEIVIPFHKSTVDDFSLSNVHIQCFEWFAQQIKNGNFTKVIVEGRSSCDDTPQGAFEISKSRADWARNQLVKHSVSYEKVEVRYLSDTQPLLDKGDCSKGVGADHNRSVLIKGE